MAVDAVTTKRVKAWLASEAKNGCPICHSKELTVDDLVGVTLLSKKTGRKKSTPTSVETYVSVSCATCAHVMLFRASTIGV
jgi:hypothetical protein